MSCLSPNFYQLSQANDRRAFEGSLSNTDVIEELKVDEVHDYIVQEVEFSMLFDCCQQIKQKLTR